MNNFFYVGSYNPYFYVARKIYRKSDYLYFIVDYKNSPVKYKGHHDLYLRQMQWINL